MISNILEGAGLILISVAAFQVNQSLGLFITGVFVVLAGFSFTDKGKK